jgi:hypothetical protein
VIVSDGRAQFIGRLIEERDGLVRLADAFEWLCPTSVDPRQGIVQRARLAIPIDSFSSLRTIDVRFTSIVRLASLAEDDASELARVLDRGGHATSGGSRIVVPTPVLKQ